MSKIEQNRERKRQAILQAAKVSFLSDGFTLANMDTVASHAQITKQTLYRYFPSKEVLFHATLLNMGKEFDDKSTEYLKQEDSKQALLDFANEFVHFHLSSDHIATLKLLIAEGGKFPELVSQFMSVGQNDTEAMLADFFQQRFSVAAPSIKVELWLGMLLSLRSPLLLGQEKPNDMKVQKYVTESTELLLNGLYQS